MTGQSVALHGLTLDAGNGCEKSLADSDPVCSEMKQTPVLDWDPVPGANLYLIYLARDETLQNMVFGTKSNPTSVPRTTNTRWIPTVALPEAQAGSGYYWFIRPCVDLTDCAADPTAASHSFDKRSVPVNGASATLTPDGNEVTFTWQDYRTTNALATSANVETGELPTQAARAYRLQVATNASFTDIIDDVKVDQTTYTSWDDLYPEGTLYWRLQAIDGTDNQLNLMLPLSFVKASTKPVLAAPSGPSPVTQPFAWGSTPFAWTYQARGLPRQRPTCLARQPRTAGDGDRAGRTCVHQAASDRDDVRLAGPQARCDQQSRRLEPVGVLHRQRDLTGSAATDRQQQGQLRQRVVRVECRSRRGRIPLRATGQRRRRFRVGRDRSDGMGAHLGHQDRRAGSGG